MKEDFTFDRFKTLFPEAQWTGKTKSAIQGLLDAGVNERALYRALCVILAASRSKPGGVGDPLPLSWDILKNLPHRLRRLSKQIESINEWPFAPDKWLASHIKEEHADKVRELAFLSRGLPNTLVFYAECLGKQIREIGRVRMATSKTRIPLNDAVKALLWRVKQDTNGSPHLKDIDEVLSALTNSENHAFDERALSRLAKSPRQPTGQIFRDICGQTNGR